MKNIKRENEKKKKRLGLCGTQMFNETINFMAQN